MDLEKAFDANISIMKGLNSNSTFDVDYLQKHKQRFIKTGELIPLGGTESVALEIGATDMFQKTLSDIYQYSTVLGTIFSSFPEKRFQHDYSFAGETFQRTAFNINLESEMFPLQDSSVDFILCGEVVEHFDIDPMFVLVEFNRLIKPNGKLLITTPNCCSARNLLKIAKGYRPHFFMQYEKSRSPYRHNFEYDVHALSKVVLSSGFSIDYISTFDVFEAPLKEAYDLIEKCKFDDKFRGDDIFILASKKGSPTNRWPDEIYV